MTPISELVAAYWRHYEMSQGDRRDRLAADDAAWAWEEVEGLARKGAPAEALALIVALVASAPTLAAVCYVGAGPLENLIGDRSQSVVDAIDAQARRDERFREALNSVIFSRQVPQPVVERLARFRS